MRKMIRLAVLAAGAAFTGCGGNGGGPTAPAGDLEGSYQSTHTIEITSGFTIVVTCTGPLVVLSQSGSAFNGSVAIDDCTLIDGEPDIPAGFTGTIANGAVEIDFGIDLGAAFAEEFPECTVVSADEAFTGTASGTRLDVSLEADLLCEDEPLGIAWRIVADRTS